MIEIISAQNQSVKNLKALKLKKEREKTGLFFIEGVKIINEALNEGIIPKEIFLSAAYNENITNNSFVSGLQARGIKMHLLPDKLFREASDTEAPQGIIAVVEAKKWKIDEISDTKGLYVVLDSIRDPGNLGTIIRTADAAGFSGAVLLKGCVDLYNPKVLRSTMGSIFHIPVYEADDPLLLYFKLKSLGINIIASHLDGCLSIYEMDLSAGTAIIVGNEAEGISGLSVENSDCLVRIPMPGKAESLNASAAAAVMMYEAVRQRILN